MGSRNYTPSTMDVIGDLKNGMLVETTKEISYLSWGVGVQAYIFTVYNRIAVFGLWLEVGATSLVGAGALMLFNWKATVPVIAVQPISAVSTTIHAFIRGRRVSLAGTNVSTALSVVGTEGISIGMATPGMILGVAPSAAVPQSVSQIGVLSSVAVLTAGTGQFSLLYAPIDTGAYAEALL